MELIPGLPDDIAVQCLIRVPYHAFPSISSVCRRWKALLQLPHFFNQRKLSGFSQRVIIMAQARFDLTQYLNKKWDEDEAIMRLTLFDPQAGTWTELPELPCDPSITDNYNDGVPQFFQVASVGYNVVVMGGWIDSKPSPLVWVYNFVSGTWRRGSNMPGGPRSNFACASDTKWTVFVAGGENDIYDDLRSALTYDVEKNEWTQLPDMPHERANCKGFFQQGKFKVVGGYGNESSALVFEVEKWGWHVEKHFLKAKAMRSSSSYVIGGDGKMYMRRSEKVVTVGERKGKWKVIAKVPKELSDCWTDMIEWDGNLLLMELMQSGVPATASESAYVLDLKTSEWTKVEKPSEYSGIIESDCWLEI